MVETQRFVYERGLEVRDDLDAHLAELFGGPFLRELADTLDGSEDLSAFLVDFLPPGRQLELPAAAKDELTGQLLLQSLQRLADRWLTHVEPGRCPREASLFGDHEKRPQEIEIEICRHRTGLSICDSTHVESARAAEPRWQRSLRER